MSQKKRSAHPFTFSLTLDNARVDCADPGIRYLELLVQSENQSSQEEQPALPLNIALVLDRSGSMDWPCSRPRHSRRHQGEREVTSKLDLVKAATLEILKRLGPDDHFALVTYDDEVDTLIPAGSQRDLGRARELVQGLRSGGGTNLSGGLAAGYEQVQGGAQPQTLNRVFLLSDGLANVGITNPDHLQELAKRAAKDGISLSTFGVGLDFDELLMSSLAEIGHGGYAFLEEAEEIIPALTQEFQAARAVLAKDLRLAITLSGGLRVDRVFSNLFRLEGCLVQAQLGDLSAGEVRRVLLRLKMPQLPEGRQLLGMAALSGLDAATGRTLSESREVWAEYGFFGESVAESQNVEIAEQAAIFEARYARFDAAQARDEGRLDEARKLMQKSLDTMQSVAAGSARVQEELAASEEYAAFMAADESEVEPEEARRMQKRARFAQQNLKRGR